MRGLYVHIPVCQHKCSYCDFYSVERPGLLEAFVEALCREIELLAEQFPAVLEEPLVTVYIGGGTPSLLTPFQLERLLERIRATFTIEPQAEWTLECNPGTVSREQLRIYRQLGLTRLSVGVQSFEEAELRFLERLHTAEEAAMAIQWAHEAGFEQVNVDLMFAVPGQTLQTWRRTLERAVALEPSHISAYSLIWEPGTALYARWRRGEIAPVPEELDVAQYELAVERLMAAGYGHYEVSNFARPGSECRHNLLYWHGEEYVALGPSAHGYVRGRRYWNVRSIERYFAALRCGKLPIAGSEHIGPRERLAELIFLGLRSDGVSFERLRREYGIELADGAYALLRRWQELGLVQEWSETHLRLNWRGYLVCDELAAELTLSAERLWERHTGSSQHLPVLDPGGVRWGSSRAKSEAVCTGGRHLPSVQT